MYKPTNLSVLSGKIKARWGMRAWNVTQLPRAAVRRRAGERDERDQQVRRIKERERKSRDPVTAWHLDLCTWRWGQQSLLLAPSCHLLLTSTCCIVLFHSPCLCKLHPSTDKSLDRYRKRLATAERKHTVYIQILVKPVKGAMSSAQPPAPKK